MNSSQKGAMLAVFLCFALFPWSAWCGGFSLRFYGNGVNDIDRVKIPIDNPAVAADIGSTDITIEFWMKANPGDNGATSCILGNDGWINGNIIVDRDVFGNGDFGDYGISLFQNGIAFGVNNGTSGDGICGTSNVADGIWHHIAVTRQISDGLLRLFVDGVRQSQTTGPTGDISYHDNRATIHPNDPFLVIGAEKHDAGPGFPSYSGLIDEIRLSTVIRYTGNFTRPNQAFVADASTAALYHFDEGVGNVINDSSTGGLSDGTRNFGGSPAGPVWSADKAPLAAIGIGFTPIITTGLSSPVAITNAGDNSGRLFISEQTGAIRLWNGTTLTTYMTVPGISPGSERGLLSVAFHPDYEQPTNGYFFTYYTNTAGDIEVSRFTVSSGTPNQGNPASKQIIITIPHPSQANHNGGQLQFGPDGYLYMGPGDGGGAGDPFENAQNINVLLGKILRLNINGALPYEIPPTNPFVGVAGSDEIWDYGMRNPWRFSFDRLLGDLIIGDVGQGAREEVDFEPAGSAGGINYGWDDMEGTICYEPMTGCLTANRVLPVLEYNHGLGCSISGGYRYRGTGIPQAYGVYFYGDFCSGRLWGGVQNPDGTWSGPLLMDTAYSITAFGEDETGEVYLSNYDGEIHKLIGAASNISVTKTDSQDPVQLGSPFSYTVVITNGGPSSASAVTLIDPLPAGVAFVSATNGCTHNNGVVTCNFGTIANGANITVQINVTATGLGTQTNTVLASAMQVDPNAANNSDSEDTEIIAVVPQADLMITKTDSQDPVLVGDQITYTLTATNNGTANATGVMITDTLPATVSFVSASAGCNNAGSTVTCNIGNLDASNNVPVTIVVTADASGTVTNNASVSANEADPVPGNNNDSEDTTVNVPVTCLFCDDFEDATLATNWTYVTSNTFWSESGGALQGTSTRKTSAVATPAFSGCINCYVETTLQSTGGAGSRVWLLHHYVDKSNAVELMIREDTDRWILRQRVGGRVLAKAKIQQQVDANVAYRVRIAYNGAEYVVLVNDVQILSLTPVGPVAGGTVGFRVKGTTGTFNYIETN